MPAPDTIDLSGGSGPWPAFTISGVTGGSASTVNGLWARNNVLDYVHVASGASCPEVTEGSWLIENGSDQFEGEGQWPWSVVTWDAVGTMTGTPAFAFALAAPGTIDLTSGGATVQATLAAGFSGSNNDLDFTAVPPGRLGNDIGVTFTATGTNAVLSVTVTAREIVINIGTGVNVPTTAAQVITAIEASAAASALVTVEAAAGNNGTGEVTTRARATLSGGTGGLPLPPDTIAL